jgi:hypothetical protein
MSSLSFKNRALNYLRNMQIKAKQKLHHAVFMNTNNEARAKRNYSEKKYTNYKKEKARRGANVWQNAKQRRRDITHHWGYGDDEALAHPNIYQTYKMNKQNTTTRNNFNAKALAQKKAPGGMAVWGGRKGKTRRNRKNRRGTRKN